MLRRGKRSDVAQCTNAGCDSPPLFFDQHHEGVALCAWHAKLYWEAFDGWLSGGTPDALREWLEVFEQSGGRLK